MTSMLSVGAWRGCRVVGGGDPIVSVRFMARWARKRSSATTEAWFDRSRMRINLYRVHAHRPSERFLDACPIAFGVGVGARSSLRADHTFSTIIPRAFQQAMA